MAARSVPIRETIDGATANAEWCAILLADLEELIALAWTMLANERLVEESFARTITHLEATACDRTAPWLTPDQMRKVLITQSIAVLESASPRQKPQAFWGLRRAKQERPSAAPLIISAGELVRLR